MPNVCEVCGKIEEQEDAATQTASVFLHDLHVCEACQKDRQYSVPEQE
ncbi:MAG: hypothetical protein ACXVDJ_07425 [Tumebacillaceae bacterium]